MVNKSIQTTTRKETLVPVCYIDSYKNIKIKKIFEDYKFKNSRNNQYLLNICIDLCISIIVEKQYSNYGQKYTILFTHPPSTMFYRKEKKFDSMENLMNQVKKYLNFYFVGNIEKYYFKSIFSINLKYLKNKKAQHINGSKKTRVKNLNQRYYLNFLNKQFLQKLNKVKTVVIVIDDISSTGSTLLACKNCLNDFDIEIKLYSLAH